MTWVPVLPALALCAALLLVPGLVIGWCLGLRGQGWLGVAPAMSLGTLGVAIVLSSRTGLAWGLLPVGLATVVLVLGAAVVGWALGRWTPARWAPTRPSWGGTGVFVSATVVCAAWVAAILIHTIGDVRSVQQVYDGVFHVNAIDRVVRLAAASPDVVAATANFSGRAGFYPPAFHALAALLAGTFGLTSVVAANVTAVVLSSLAWIVSVTFLGRCVLGRRPFGLVATAVVGSVVPLFPYLVLTYGVLWPYALAVAVVPAVVGCIAIVLGMDDDPAMSAPQAVVVGLVAAAGMYYAHPGAVFAALAVGAVVLGCALWRGVSRLPALGRWGNLAALGAVVLLLLTARLLWGLVSGVPMLKRIVGYDHGAWINMAGALGNALALKTPESPATWWVALLVALGVVWVVRARRGTWLLLAHALLVYLFMQAAGSDEPLSNELTGFWYNDSFRLAALLPVTGVPLAALGLRAVRDRVLREASRWQTTVDGGGATASRPALPVRAGVGALLVGAFVLALPGGVWLTDAAATVRKGYYATSQGSWLADPAEAELYRRTLTPGHEDGLLVIGNPWSGGALAGPVSGRQSVYGHLANVLDPDRDLLRTRFRDIGTDPEVCAAAERLHVGYAVDDPRVYWPHNPGSKTFPGVSGLAGRPGLKLLAREGAVSVYRVLPCTAR